jgi:hypothetical protein
MLNAGKVVAAIALLGAILKAIPASEHPQENDTQRTPSAKSWTAAVLLTVRSMTNDEAKRDEELPKNACCNAQGTAGRCSNRSETKFVYERISSQGLSKRC